jgi:hypothetical protein
MKGGETGEGERREEGKKGRERDWGEGKEGSEVREWGG